MPNKQFISRPLTPCTEEEAERLKKYLDQFRGAIDNEHLASPPLFVTHKDLEVRTTEIVKWMLVSDSLLLMGLLLVMWLK